jgi:hypothetical protein
MDAYLHKALETIERTVGPLSVETIARKSEGRWSIAEILEHLSLAFTFNTATIEKALASGEVRGREPRLTQLLGRILVVDVGYFPRVEAPERTRPHGSVPPERSLETIRHSLAELDVALSRAAARFGDLARVANHPYFQGLTVPQWRKFHWRHTVHHMKQVRLRAEVLVDA